MATTRKPRKQTLRMTARRFRPPHFRKIRKAARAPPDHDGRMNEAIDVGHFSISLAVADLAKARAFYETLGFTVLDGKPEERWLVMKNGEAKIGLFQGMFEDNLITLNPPDARGLERRLKDAGYELVAGTKTDAGPCSCLAKDPDGNLVLIDQFHS